jgi:hypothetical protein
VRIGAETASTTTTLASAPVGADRLPRYYYARSHRPWGSGAKGDVHG